MELTPLGKTLQMMKEEWQAPLLKRVAELERALHEYGRHKAACGSLRVVERRGHHGEVVYGQCDCGLDDVKGGA